jgi:hypothetical protein
MNMEPEDVLTDDERLDLWAELMAIANAIQDYCDQWWLLDRGIRDANDLRCHKTRPGLHNLLH